MSAPGVIVTRTTGAGPELLAAARSALASSVRQRSVCCHQCCSNAQSDDEGRGAGAAVWNWRAGALFRFQRPARLAKRRRFAVVPNARDTLHTMASAAPDAAAPTPKWGRGAPRFLSPFSCAGADGLAWRAGSAHMRGDGLVRIARVVRAAHVG